MIIKGTPLIRGMLDLPTIKKQVGKNDSLPLSDNEFWSSDVQIALKMGYLTAIGETERFPGPDGEIERVIKLVNRNKSPLNLPNHNHSIPAGAEFTLKESELRDVDIRSAIAKGLIEVINAVETTPTDEGFVKLGSEPPSSEPEKQQFSQQLEHLTPAQRALLEAAQKAQSPQEKPPPPALDTNEELSGLTRVIEPVRVIDTENPPPVTADDIPDALGESVVFNPTGEKPVRVMKNASVAEPKVGRGITFVDEQQTQERIEQHPTLKPQKHEELELLDLEDVGRRRNPKLSAQKSDDGVEVIE